MFLIFEYLNNLFSCVAQFWVLDAWNIYVYVLTKRQKNRYHHKEINGAMVWLSFLVQEVWRLIPTCGKVVVIFFLPGKIWNKMSKRSNNPKMTQRHACPSGLLSPFFLKGARFDSYARHIFQVFFRAKCQTLYCRWRSSSTRPRLTVSI
jgi:hypothetical protein